MAIAGERQGLPFLVFAPHRGLKCMGNLLGCSFPFRSTPSCPLLDMADYRLTTFMHVHVFHGDLLLAASSVALKSFHLGGERPSQLVKRPFCAVLSFDRFRVV